MTDKQVNKYIKDVWKKFNRLTDEKIKRSIKRQRSIAMKTSNKQKLNNFKNALGGNCEMFFSQGNIKKDYEFVRTLLDRQGYWSGIYNKFYFDEDLNLTNVESRF